MSGSPVVRWRADLVVVPPVEGSDTVWLFADSGPTRLAGSLAAPMAAAIDGERDMDEVVEAAAGSGVEPMKAHAVLLRWLSAGHIVLDSGSSAPPSVRLVAGDDAAAESLRSALGVMGVEVRDDAPLTAVVLDDLLHAGSVTEDGPWVPVRLRGSRVAVGPVLGVGGGCATCLAQRHTARRGTDVVAARLAGLPGPPPRPMTHPAAAALAAAVLAAGPGSHLITIDVTTLERTAHALVPLPGCPSCDPGGRSGVEAELLPSPGAGFPADGGLRTADPDQTFREYSHLISDEIGVVPLVERSGTTGLHVFVAGANPAVDETADLAQLRSSLRGSSAGKGTTESGARAGALAEALERHSSLWRGDEPVVRARMADLEGAIHPNDVQLYSQRQLSSPDAGELPAAGVVFHYVPRPFDTTAVHEWTSLRALGSDAPAWLPTAQVWLRHPAQRDGGVRACSNGLAAGNTVEEALLQGLLELVERDSVALWWYSRALRPGIDLDTSTDPRVRAAVAPLRALGRDVWALDLTADLGIPAAVAMSALPDGTRVLHGFGAHVDPVMAVVRALTEVAQMEASADAGAGFGAGGAARLGSLATVEREWLDDVTTATDPWLAPHGVVPLADPWSGDLDSALALLLGRLSGVGLSAYWVDLTRRDIGLPVVRAVVPGLRHFWNRFAPGRLYDVPPRIGWVPADYGEDDLNPRWVFL